MGRMKIIEEERRREIEIEREEEKRRRAEEEAVKEEERRAEEKIRMEEEKEIEEVRKIEKRIRELEDSISASDWQLERAEIEKMNMKTRRVKKRMLQSQTNAKDSFHCNSG